MNKIEMYEIKNEVKSKLDNSFEIFSFWQIIDCCELDAWQKRWAKAHLTYDVRFCTSQEIITNYRNMEEAES